MIPVFVCESDSSQRENIKKVIDNFVMIEDMDMEVIATDNPEEVLAMLEDEPTRNGIYFLDINLSHDMNGITLASKIREVDSQGVIVFVTAHAELMYLMFAHKLEVMDFIVKDTFEKIDPRICECLQLAYERLLKNNKVYQQFYQVKIGGKIKMIPYEEIMFFETSLAPHILILHLTEDKFEFRGAIKEVANDEHFFRCHKSVVVNLSNVRSIDISKRELELADGSICPISAKAMKELKSLNIPSVTHSA